MENLVNREFSFVVADRSASARLGQFLDNLKESGLRLLTMRGTIRPPSNNVCVLFGNGHQGYFTLHLNGIHATCPPDLSSVVKIVQHDGIEAKECQITPGNYFSTATIHFECKKTADILLDRTTDCAPPGSHVPADVVTPMWPRLIKDVKPGEIVSLEHTELGNVRDIDPLSDYSITEIQNMVGKIRAVWCEISKKELRSRRLTLDNFPKNMDPPQLVYTGALDVYKIDCNGPFSNAPDEKLSNCLRVVGSQVLNGIGEKWIRVDDESYIELNLTPEEIKKYADNPDVSVYMMVGWWPVIAVDDIKEAVENFKNGEIVLTKYPLRPQKSPFSSTAYDVILGIQGYEQKRRNIYEPPEYLDNGPCISIFKTDDFYAFEQETDTTNQSRIVRVAPSQNAYVYLLLGGNHFVDMDSDCN